MGAKKWTLTDVAERVSLEEIAIPAAFAGSGTEVIAAQKRTLRGGLTDGVEVVRIDNGRLSFEILPTRGMGLWKAWLGGLEIGWQSPVRGPVHPRFVPLAEPSGLGWLDGFDELLVRCGLESNGAADFDGKGRLLYALHGRIANRPAHKVVVEVNDETGEIRLAGEVEETRFHFMKLRMVSTVVTRAGEPSLAIEDEIVNLSGSPADFQLLYHINFGLPLLGPGASFVAPVRKVAPRDARAAEGMGAWNRYAREEAGFKEQAYYLELLADARGNSRALLRNHDGTQGVSLHLNTRQLPCFTLWKNTIAAADGYVTGLEPGTNFPNARTFEGERGRVVRLGPGARTKFAIGLEIHDNPADVRRAEEAIKLLQAGASPEVASRPEPGWCP